MVSPMREKRVWPPQDKDADGETAAAFEAAVAVVKETVVRSGEVLVSAKEDLSNHQRWLKVQTAAVEADRERHARWLQRQRERQEAIERREKRRARRRARRQAAARSLKDGVAAAVFAVRSTVWRLFATIAAGLNAIDATALNGVRWIGARAPWRCALCRRSALAGRVFGRDTIARRRTRCLFFARFRSWLTSRFARGERCSRRRQGQHRCARCRQRPWAVLWRCRGLDAQCFGWLGTMASG